MTFKKDNNLDSNLIRPLNNRLNIMSCSDRLSYYCISKDKGDFNHSLLLHGVEIINLWLEYISEIQNIEPWKASESYIKSGQIMKTYASHLIARRKVCNNFYRFYNICKLYIRESEDYDYEDKWELNAFSGDQRILDLVNKGYVAQYLDQLHNLHSTARLVITDTKKILTRVLDWGFQIIKGLCPSDEDIAKAFDDNLREWVYAYRNETFKELKEELNRYYKERRTDPYTRELWGELLCADENILKLAMKQELAKCNDEKLENWGKNQIRGMDNYCQLMKLFYMSCKSEELFVLKKSENLESFVALLTPINYTLLFYIITRRSLIQCEIFPELKKQYDAWLYNTKEQSGEDKAVLSAARQSKLDEIVATLKNGNWKLPATADNIETLLNACFGKDTSALDDSDAEQCEKMWHLIEGGRGERKDILVANLAGFFSEENLLAGSPKEISNDLFGNNNNQCNNINKGKSNNCSNAFGDVIPFLKKYADKIIRQV